MISSELTLSQQLDRDANRRKALEAAKNAPNKPAIFLSPKHSQWRQEIQAKIDKANGIITPKPEKRQIKKISKTPKLPVKPKKAPQQVKKSRGVKGNRQRVYDDYVLGLSLQELAQKYGISKRTISSYVSKQKQSLGLSRNLQGMTYRKACKFFAETDKNNTEIGEILGIAAHTVCYHRKKYNSENGIL